MMYALFIVGCFVACFGGLIVGLIFAEKVLLKAFERKIKKIVKKCREEWQAETIRLKSVYGDVDNYIEDVVEKALRRSEFIEKT